MKLCVFKTLILVCLAVVFLTVIQCSSKVAPELPKEILGIGIGMSKPEIQTHLEAIATFESEGRKVGQLWKLKNDKHFDSIAVAFDRENKVRYVTAFVEKAAAKEKMRFDEVGDLTKAKVEIVEPHYRYIWEVPAADDRAAYIVNIYGDNPEFVQTYSLSKTNQSGEDEDEE